MNTKEFTKRRKRLCQIMGPNSIAIIPTAASAVRNRDVEYPYRPDSDFYYLTGFDEPDAVAVLIPKRGHGEYILFCREKDPVMETWNGRIHGLEGARENFGADDAFPIGDIDEILPGLLENCERVFYAMGCNLGFDQRVIGWVNQLRVKARAGVHSPGEFVALDHVLHDMRLYKSREELSVMRKAAKISVQAHIRAMQTCRPGMMEYQVEAELLHHFHANACTTAYGSIVGGGENACILHYTQNNQKLNDGDLLLIDAGAEHQNYAADITRTFPVNGRFSKEQKQIYDLVLAAQEAAFEKIQAGNHWNEPHDAAVKTLTKGLLKLGLLKGTLKQAIKDKTYARFYMHKTGHWLGMDVHDVGDYKVGEQWRVLEPGMVMTVEPGLYISPQKGVAKKWWNTGVRIEDDVLVTKNGYDILSKGLPRTTKEIETLMARTRNGQTV